MNCFCYPGIVNRELAQLFRVDPETIPQFGVDGAVPLLDGTRDTTEIDMRLGSTNVEAKLTEVDFTQCAKPRLERYAGLDDIFDRSRLPLDGDEYLSYQLIRNVLAIARRPESRFVVLLDARRPDLLREWWKLFSTIRDGGVRDRCSFILWQEVAAAAPRALRKFLGEKYGL